MRQLVLQPAAVHASPLSSRPSRQLEVGDRTDSLSLVRGVTVEARLDHSRLGHSNDECIETAVASLSRPARATAFGDKPRRVLAITLPRLVCELAAQKQTCAEAEPIRAEAAFAVVIASESDTADLKGRLSISGVSTAAHRYGVRVGQTIIEARARVAHLQVHVLTPEEITQALQHLAECLLRFAALVSIEAPADLGFHRSSRSRKPAPSSLKAVTSDAHQPTIWLDITSTAHLFGGEAELCLEVQSVIEALEHEVSLAVANGPRLSRAFAECQHRKRQIVTPTEMPNAVDRLPISALPVTSEVRAWLIKLGLFSFSELKKLPAKTLSSRLGVKAEDISCLLQGLDSEPLSPYVPVCLPREDAEWDEPLTGIEPLLFVLRRLTNKVATRLEGRGLAAQRVRLGIQYDRSVARFENKVEQRHWDFELASPLWRADELFRIVSARLSKCSLEAPSIGLWFEVLALTTAHQRQLDLAQVQLKVEQGGPEARAVLYGELAADIGRHRFGTLQVLDSHRPEKMSVLQPVSISSNRSGSHSAYASHSSPSQGRLRFPSRLFVHPIAISVPFRRGALLPLGLHIYSLERVCFECRLEGVEWWSNNPVSRDYLRLWLRGPEACVEVLAFVEMVTGQRFLQGVYD